MHGGGLQSPQAHPAAQPALTSHHQCRLQIRPNRLGPACWSLCHNVRLQASASGQPQPPPQPQPFPGGPLPRGAHSPFGGTPPPGTPPLPPFLANQKKTPFQQQVLNTILGISNVPYSSYVPTPITALHKVDARIKQLWLVSIYFLIAKATPTLRLSIALSLAGLTMATLPPRLWKSQLARMGMLCGTIFVMAALGSDGIPPVLQPRVVPEALGGLPALQPTGYSYVLLHIWMITVTHRSIKVGLTGAALTFTSLQMASLCLTSTPGEEMAVALAWWLAPLRLLGVPVREMALTLLLSLRFMSLVFEEVRNLSLGLAARGVDWQAQGTGGSIQMAGRLCVRLFANLFERSEKISQAMLVRGFQGPSDHNLYMMKINPTCWVANVCALLVLAAYSAVVFRFK